MAGLSLRHIYKVYPGGTKAVNDFNIEIQDKEFVVFVGPSGCGKSTTLRMIAGLEEITAGELYIDGRLVNDEEPKKRDVAMVFQNYALYPHMTVAGNMAFALKMRGMPKAERMKKVQETAEILGLTEYLNKKPAEMSGGQRQRVALGRAIVREPKVFLLDEPLSNLDAKLRTHMRSEITKIHERVQTTFIYVTHDQTEAMTMGDRIVVMKDGYIHQIDTPKNLYNDPVNVFVAGFIGTPAMNFFDAALKKEGTKTVLSFCGGRVVVPPERLYKIDKNYLDGKTITVGIRPEGVKIAAAEAEGATMKCVVNQIEDLGSESILYCSFDLEDVHGFGKADNKITVKAPAGQNVHKGQVIDIAYDYATFRYFDKQTGNTVCPAVPAINTVMCAADGASLKLYGAQIKLPPALEGLSGELSAVIPTDAIRFGSGIPVTVQQKEDTQNGAIVRFTVGSESMFALVKGEAPAEGKAKAEVDWKRVSFYKDGTLYKAALQDVNVLEGRLIKVKLSRRQKKEYKAPFAVDFVVDDVKMRCPHALVKRLAALTEHKLFGKPVELRFSLDAVRTGTGLPAVKTGVADYGTEQYTVCTAGGARLCLAGGDLPQTFMIEADMERAALYDKTLGIRLT